MKSFRKLITLFIAISIAIVLPCSALPKKSEAAGSVTTPSPTSTVVINFTSGTRQQINVGVVSSGQTTSTICTQNTNKFTLSTLTTKYATDVVNKLTSPGGFDESYAISEYDCPTTGNFILDTGETVLVGNKGSTYKFGGMHKKIFGVNTKFSFDDGNDYTRAINSKPSRSTIGKTIAVSANSVNQYCSQTITLWKTIRGNLSDLFGKKPVENKKYWTESDESAKKRQTAMSKYSWGDYIPVVQIFTTIKKWKIGWEEFGQFYLTDEGVSKLNEIYATLTSLQSSVDGLIAGMTDSTSSWPCQPAPQKMDESYNFAGESITSPAAFSEALKTLTKNIGTVLGKYQTTGGADDTVSCPKIGTSNSKIFSWMFCQLGSALNSVATWTLTKAFGFLTDALGTDMPIKNIFGSLDSSITSSPSAAK